MMAHNEVDEPKYAKYRPIGIQIGRTDAVIAVIAVIARIKRLIA